MFGRKAHEGREQAFMKSVEPFFHLGNSDERFLHIQTHRLGGLLIPFFATGLVGGLMGRLSILCHQASWVNANRIGFPTKGAGYSVDENKCDYFVGE